MTFDALRLSLFTAVLIVLAGYLLVFRPLETTVADRYAQLDTARTSLERSLALTRRIPALAAERSALDAQLGRMHVRDARAATIERFLHTLAAVAARDGVTVESVAAETRGALTPAATRARTLLFDELPLDLTMRGSYGNVIRAIRELDGGDIAARISLASLGAADRRPGVRPQLNAAFHVRLLREAHDKTTHDPRAR